MLICFASQHGLLCFTLTCLSFHDLDAIFPVTYENHSTWCSWWCDDAQTGDAHVFLHNSGKRIEIENVIVLALLERQVWRSPSFSFMYVHTWLLFEFPLLEKYGGVRWFNYNDQVEGLSQNYFQQKRQVCWKIMIFSAWDGLSSKLCFTPAPPGLFPHPRPTEGLGSDPPPAISRTNGRIEPREALFESSPRDLPRAYLRL